MNASADVPLLCVQNLRVQFQTRTRSTITAVDDVSFQIRAGEIFGLVGESGCGKTVTCRSLIQLFSGTKPASTTGSIRLAGRELTRLSDQEWGMVRGSEIAMVFQDPMTSLNPTMRIGAQIIEGLRRHRRIGPDEARAEAIAMLASVGVTAPKRRLEDYPHAFSGGMRQRVLIAIALACGPRLLIADEPTTALDVTIQDQILKLILKLRTDTAMGVLLVTHDLGVIAQTCDRVAVMYAGRIVESGEARQIFAQPSHPYTRALLAALPAHARRGERLNAISGEAPDLAAPPPGCRFHPRCAHAVGACRTEVPIPVNVGPGHTSACLRIAELK